MTLPPNTTDMPASESMVCEVLQEREDGRKEVSLSLLLQFVFAYPRQPEIFVWTSLEVPLCHKISVSGKGEKESKIVHT
jgi:hypothetical protein